MDGRSRLCFLDALIDQNVPKLSLITRTGIPYDGQNAFQVIIRQAFCLNNLSLKLGIAGRPQQNTDTQGAVCRPALPISCIKASAVWGG